MQWREVRKRARRPTLRNRGRLSEGDIARAPLGKTNRHFPARQAKKWQHRQKKKQGQRFRAIRKSAMSWELEQWISVLL